MKQLLFLVAIYSLIIHQSRKNARGIIFPGEQKTLSQKIITGSAPSSVKLYRQPFVLPSDSNGRSDFISSYNVPTHAKWSEKD